MKTIKLSMLFLILASVSFVTCRKIEKEETVPAESKSIKDCQVDGNFSWSTTRNLDIRLATTHSGVVYIRPAEGNFTYHKGFLTRGVPYTTKLTLPSYVSQLKLSLNGKETSVSISGNTLTYTFE